MVAQGDGRPLRDHLASLARTSGRQDPQLNATCPEEWEHVWEWFKTLSNRRSRPNPISFAEVGAWQRLVGARPTPREVRMIVKLDDMFREIVWGAN